MKRGRSTTTPTKAQSARFDAIKETGCIVCRHFHRLASPAEIHHLTIGGKHGQKRRGHDFTIGLCPYHHRGYDLYRESHYLGPSYALSPRKFREQYGSDDDLMELQKRIIEGEE